MHSMKSIVGKESNTAKGVNFATEFNEFKNTLFNKRIFRNEHQWKDFKAKNIISYDIIKCHIVFWWQKICFRWWYLYTCLFY